MRVAILSNTSMHLSGYLPTVVSPLNMIASASSKTALATSVTSARVGMGDSIMLSSMCVATMTGRPTRRAHFHDAPLHDGQFFVRDFNAQITARDHDAICFLNDGFEIFDGLLIFDLGDDQRA